MTLLHYACKSGARGMGGSDDACQAVSWLLQQGADPYVRCRWTNMAAIHYAAYFDVAPVASILLAATKGIGRLRYVLKQRRSLQELESTCSTAYLHQIH